MSAGVHDARLFRHHAAVVGGFLLGDGVDVGAQGHRWSRLSALQHRHRAGLHADVDQMEAHGQQLVLDDLGGAHLVKTQFRVPVDILFDGLELRRQGQRFLQIFVHVHSSLSGCLPLA